MDDFGVVKLVLKANTPKSSKTRHLSESSNDYFNVVPETTRKSSNDHFFTGFSVIWRLSYHLRTTEWQTSNRQMMVLWQVVSRQMTLLWRILAECDHFMKIPRWSCDRWLTNLWRVFVSCYYFVKTRKSSTDDLVNTLWRFHDNF